MHGKGPALMLIHGFGEDGTVWDDVVNQLEDDYLLIIPDLPGIGLSAEFLPASGYFDLKDLAGEMLAILVAEKLEKCVMLGHSMGGYVTLAFAETYPEFLSGFGLVNSTAYADTEEKRAVREKSARFLRKHGAALFVAQMIPGFYHDEYHKKYGNQINEHISIASCLTAEVLAMYQEMMMNRIDRAHILEQTKIPVLFIIGPEDNILTLKESQRQSRLAIRSHVHILQSTAHMGIKEDPHGAATAIQNFMSILL